MHCRLVSVLMKTTLICKGAVPKMSSVYDNFCYKTTSACSNSQLKSLKIGLVKQSVVAFRFIHRTEISELEKSFYPKWSAG